MKTFKELMELVAKSWKDIKNSNVKKEAGKILKALDVNEILAYSAKHDEFSKFKNEDEFKKAKKSSGKKMNWIKVERRIVDGEILNEAFSFKGAVKHGFLDKYDKPKFDELEKKGWKVEEFLLTGKGFEIVIKKGSKRMEFIDKTPSKVLTLAAKKAR